MPPKKRIAKKAAPAAAKPIQPTKKVPSGLAKKAKKQSATKSTAPVKRTRVGGARKAGAAEATPPTPAKAKRVRKKRLKDRKVRDIGLGFKGIRPPQLDEVRAAAKESPRERLPTAGPVKPPKKRP